MVYLSVKGNLMIILLEIVRKVWAVKHKSWEISCVRHYLNSLLQALIYEMKFKLYWYTTSQICHHHWSTTHRTKTEILSYIVTQF